MNVMVALLALLIYAGIYVFIPDSWKKWFWICLAGTTSLDILINVLKGNWFSAAPRLVWVLFYLILWDKEKNSS